MTTMIINSPTSTSLFEGRAVYTPEDLDNATQPLSFLLELWREQPASAEDLMDLADGYESTQPGYAADLRAAAQMQAA